MLFLSWESAIHEVWSKISCQLRFFREAWIMFRPIWADVGGLTNILRSWANNGPVAQCCCCFSLREVSLQLEKHFQKKKNPKNKKTNKQESSFNPDRLVKCNVFRRLKGKRMGFSKPMHYFRPVFSQTSINFKRHILVIISIIYVIIIL